MLINAIGSKTIPAEMMRMEATWKAVSETIPSFIKMKLLPHIKESRIKSSQLSGLLLFKLYRFE